MGTLVGCPDLPLRAHWPPEFTQVAEGQGSGRITHLLQAGEGASVRENEETEAVSAKRLQKHGEDFIFQTLQRNGQKGRDSGLYQSPLWENTPPSPESQVCHWVPV